VVDLYCHEYRLIVEVDGGHYFEHLQAALDEDRAEWLRSKGLTILRFSNREVLSETEGVLEQIRRVIEGEEGPPSPQPSP
jgi:very-short-patch-repair endonuclease